MTVDGPSAPDAPPADHPRRCTWRNAKGERCSACWVRRDPEQVAQQHCHVHVQSRRDRRCTAERSDGKRCGATWSEANDRQSEQARCSVHVVPEMKRKTRKRRR